MTSASVLGLIPASVLDSPLMKKGGYEVLEGFPDKRTFDRMRAEALKLFPSAFTNELEVTEVGGRAARRQLRTTSVHAQRAFYHGRRTLRLIREVSGLPLAPAGSHGGYIYYARPGDHIDIHRDSEGCDLAVITCLADTPNRGDGGMLCLYPGRIFERIDAIRATPQTDAVRVRLLPGQTMLLWGGFVAHSVVPVSRRQTRIVSSLCYRLVLPGKSQRATTARRTPPRGRQ